MSRYHLFRHALRHRFQARRAYSVHSPFVFDFYQNVLRASHPKPPLEIEGLRRLCIRSDEVLTYPDFGAIGQGQTVSRPLGELARRAARGPWEGAFLHRLLARYQPQRGLELGTHLGFSSLYQVTALGRRSRWITLEGAPALAQVAKGHFKALGLKVELHTGQFETLLERRVNLATYRPDYVFIDGNHRYEATLGYFHQLLPHLPAGALLV